MPVQKEEGNSLSCVQVVHCTKPLTFYGVVVLQMTEKGQRGGTSRFISVDKSSVNRLRKFRIQ